MQFNKPPEWGARFQFPENTEVAGDGLTFKMTEKMACSFAEKYDEFIAEEIGREARAAGISDCTVLNKKAILEALNKQIPKKPTYVDTRFRNRGKHISDGVSLDKCYKCPNCWSHIFHVWDSEIYCPHCGQALDWQTEPPKEE